MKHNLQWKQFGWWAIALLAKNFILALPRETGCSRIFLRFTAKSCFWYVVILLEYLFHLVDFFLIAVLWHCLKLIFFLFLSISKFCCYRRLYFKVRKMLKYDPQSKKYESFFCYFFITVFFIFTESCLSIGFFLPVLNCLIFNHSLTKPHILYVWYIYDIYIFMYFFTYISFSDV